VEFGTVLRESGPGSQELLQLADLSLAEFLRHLARYGGAIHEEDGLLLFAGAHPEPNPYRNGVLRLDHRLAASEVLRRADEFFAGRRSGYVVWAREHAAADLDALALGSRMVELERLRELVLDELPPEVAAPDGVEVRRAVDRQTRRDYLRVVASAWGMAAVPLELAARVFFDPHSGDPPNVAAFVAYYDGVPLSGAMTFLTHGVALGCQAATVPAGERRGLAESCLWEALRVSFDELGARRSLCQTTVLAAPVWHRLGYVPFTSYARYLVPPQLARAAAG
jgi:hypothetical protein